MDRLVQHNVLAMSGRVGRGRGRRRHAAARQDRHDHARQPPGDRVPPGAWRQRCDARRRCATGIAGRRDARGALDRRAREGEVRHSRPRFRGHTRRPSCRSRRTRACRASISTAGRSARARSTPSSGSCSRAWQRGACRSSRRRSSGSHVKAVRRWPLPRTAASLGVIHLKDIVKGGIRDRFAHLRAMGIKTVMITGDNPLTAAAIAAEAGVDDFMARGDARRQAEADPHGAGGRPHGRDDRRRHQRCAGARAGGCRCGDEHRHDGGQGSRQHGRPRLEPDQADRDRRDRQAAADDARCADDVLDRQRRGEVLRDHPGDVHPGVPAAERC